MWNIKNKQKEQTHGENTLGLPEGRGVAGRVNEGKRITNYNLPGVK